MRTAPDLYVPPEWTDQAYLWVGWPHLREEWGDAFDPARAEIAALIEHASQFAVIKIACGSEEAYDSAVLALRDVTGDVQLHRVPSGDIWLRDTGPIFAEHAGTTALCFEFNGWGGKYVMPGDTETAAAIASAESVKPREHSFVLEGGAVDFDGAGRVLTTRQCLLHPNRNAGWTEADAETALAEAFGVSEVIWLGDGLINDHTDGHVDNLARFIGPGRVICQHPSGDDDPNAAVFEACRSALNTAGLEVVTIPSPGRILAADGRATPASHMNFLISNGAVFLPIYERVYSEVAVRALQAHLPDHEIIPLPAGAILAGGGSFHCMTRDVPRFPLKRTR